MLSFSVALLGLTTLAFLGLGSIGSMLKTRDAARQQVDQ